MPSAGSAIRASDWPVRFRSFTSLPLETPLVEYSRTSSHSKRPQSNCQFRMGAHVDVRETSQTLLFRSRDVCREHIVSLAK
jgi:hypothetical protein